MCWDIGRSLITDVDQLIFELPISTFVCLADEHCRFDRLTREEVAAD